MQELFPDQLAFLCDSYPKCVLKITEKCQRQSTKRPNTTRTTDRIDELIRIIKKHEEKISHLEVSQQTNNEMPSKLQENVLQSLNGVNSKIDSLTNRFC